MSDSIVLGGGCFWCLEALFKRLDGVEEVMPGYAGGHTEDPTYEDVCRGDTGHAEVVKVVFDPAILPLGRLMDAFFNMHDPTQSDGQGHDIGTQYRSVILYTDEKQKLAAEKVMARAQGSSKRPIVTQILPLTKFYPAEEYHYDYYDRNPDQPYCRAVIAPKVAKLKA
jgi:peptide-methionine (S)-S-oxide reductase